MDSNTLRLLPIPVFVIVTFMIVNFVRNKIYKPKYENNVQKPGKLEHVIANILIFLSGFLLLLAILGIFTKNKEMALVCGGLALFFLVIVIVLKRAQDTSYQENSEYFILRTGKKVEQLFYEDIIDWQPSFNEIAILDKTREDEKYIRVNVKIFKPEILLRKIADLAFEGKFRKLNSSETEDPNREAETIYYLINNQYEYLVEDYRKKIENQP